MTPKQIDILLSTYNGQEYLRQLLDSLLAQTFISVLIIIRDDGSSDATVDILKEYEIRYPGQFQLHLGEENLGALGSFERLCKYSTADYVLFCDQDDIWFPDKVQTLFDEILRIEKFYGNDVPVLVCSDLMLIDKYGNQTYHSFWEYAGISWSENQPETIFLSNCVTGCASIFNRKLLLTSLPFPKEAIMHDWWMGAVAAFSGKLVLLPLQTIGYRQHSGNVFGCGFSKSILSIPRKLLSRISGKHANNYFRICIAQANALCIRLDLRRVSSACHIEQLVKANKFTTFYHLLKNPMLRKKTIFLNPKFIFY